MIENRSIRTCPILIKNLSIPDQLCKIIAFLITRLNFKLNLNLFRRIGSKPLKSIKSPILYLYTNLRDCTIPLDSANKSIRRLKSRLFLSKYISSLNYRIYYIRKVKDLYKKENAKIYFQTL